MFTWCSSTSRTTRSRTSREYLVDELICPFFPMTQQVESPGNPGRFSISKREDTYLRTLVIHGARSVLIGSKAPPQWALRVVERRALNVAVVALPNKMARTIWALLAHDWAYRNKYASSRRSGRSEHEGERARARVGQGTTRDDGKQVRPGLAKPESPIGREVRTGSEARVSGFHQGQQAQTSARTGRIQSCNLPAPSHQHRSLQSGRRPYKSVIGLTGMCTRSRQSHHGSAPRTAAAGARQSDGRPAVGRRILVRPLPSASIRYRLGVWEMTYGVNENNELFDVHGTPVLGRRFRRRKKAPEGPGQVASGVATR